MKTILLSLGCAFAIAGSAHAESIHFGDNSRRVVIEPSHRATVYVAPAPVCEPARPVVIETPRREIAPHVIVERPEVVVETPRRVAFVQPERRDFRPDVRYDREHRRD